MSRLVPFRVACLLGVAAAGILLTACGSPSAAPVVTDSGTAKPAVTDPGVDFGTPVPIPTNVLISPTPAADGTTVLVDDYGVLVITVPDTWTSTNTQGFTDDIGHDWAQIAASTDLEAYANSWAVSGVEYGASPASDVITDDSLIEFLDSVADVYSTDCTPFTTHKPYDDGIFQGSANAYTDCGGIGTDAFAVVAFNTTHTQIVYVRGQVVADEDEQAVYDLLINSFNSTL